VEVIDDDGSPRGRKYFALWNPAPLGRGSLARCSANDDAVMWLEEAVEADGQALAFTRTRQAAELIHRYLRQSLAEQRSPYADKVRRAGDRHRLARRCAAGELSRHDRELLAASGPQRATA
jgi:DEAD/DEAH box helicase domain-containing protein